LEDFFGLPDRSSPENIGYFIKFWVRFVSIRQEITAVKQSRPEPKGRIPPTSRTFVFTHHDLAPRNLLLDPTGKLWLLDWDLAGFYPLYFEYAAMQNFHVPND
jgi:thiamine kinase-like enzyme